MANSYSVPNPLTEQEAFELFGLYLPLQPLPRAIEMRITSKVFAAVKHEMKCFSKISLYGNGWRGAISLLIVFACHPLVIITSAALVFVAILTLLWPV